MREAPFIGRQRELERLGSFLEIARAGNGQVAFVTGEAGTGKTALVNTFAERMQDVYGDLIVVGGSCSAQGGISDPYLPFRELLSLLTGVTPARTARGSERLRTVAAHSIQLLVEVGPSLIGTFIPGGSLVGTLGKFFAKKAGWIDELEKMTKARRDTGTGAGAIEPERIFEQYANVLKALSKDRPLMLVLEDLHWADDASASLLFHLSRRIETSRILILGTYRPDEVQAESAERLSLGQNAG